MLIETFTQDYNGKYIPWKGYTVFLKVSSTGHHMLDNDGKAMYEKGDNKSMKDKVLERFVEYKGECVAG